ncbi:MAG: hypothetical protein MJ094_08395 [Saccharofermentans sp.]|nr:hypothetical protein [Saccharofermentans sp.]
MAENNVNGEIVPEVKAPVDTSAKIEIPKDAVTAPASVAVPVAPVEAPVVDPKASAAAKKADDKAAKKAADKAAKAEAKQNKKSEKKVKKTAEALAKIDQCPKEYKPVSTGTYFWTGFLCLLPAIGIIITIIMSIVPRNKNIKNFVRAILIADAICIILFLIMSIITVAFGGNQVADLIWPFAQFVEDMASALGL